MRKLLGILGVLGLTVLWGTYVLSVMSFRQAQASRNSSGTYTVFAGTTPVVSLQTIGSSLWNNAWNDMAADMTLSLDRNGRGGMLAALRGIDGTVAAPSLSFTSETGSGLFRNGAGDVRMAILGALGGQWTANGYRTAAGAVATPSYSFTAETGTGWYRAGAGDIRFALSGVDKQFSTANGFGLGATPITIATAPTIYVKGISNHGYLAVDTDTTTKEAGLNFLKSAALKWEVYVPGSSSDLRFNDGTADRLTLANGGGLTIAAPGLLVGIPNDGSGFKHQSVAGCTTAAAVGATCSSTLTWTTTFADASYHAFCGCNGTTGVPVVASYSVAASAVSITTAALTAVAATCTNISCVAVHN